MSSSPFAQHAMGLQLCQGPAALSRGFGRDLTLERKGMEGPQHTEEWAGSFRRRRTFFQRWLQTSS